jgi:DNA (cytosine-5)-methyltransferase 1
MTLLGIDFFAGAGGFSLAASQSGLRVRAAVELNKHACTTYRKNFVEGKTNPPHLFEGDIADISWPEFLQSAKLAPGKCDVVLGGPPCQGFSAHRIKGAGVDDPRNSLLLRYFECIDKVRPRTFIVENVAGLLWPRHRPYLQMFLDLADKCGYQVLGPTVLNARDYGVPQNRKRVFIVGVRKSEHQVKVTWPPPPTHFNPESDDVLVRRQPAWKTAKTVFNKPIRKKDPNNCHMQSGEKLVAIFRSTPLNGGSRKDSSRVLPCHDSHDGHKDVYGRIHPNRPGPTMTTACINPSKGRFVHPTEHHGITARHAARFQGFPDSFEFSGGLIASGQQIGNAVPIALGEIVIKSVTSALTTSDKTKPGKSIKAIHSRHTVPMVESSGQVHSSL